MSAGNNHCMAVKSSTKGSWHSAASFKLSRIGYLIILGSVLQLNLTHRTKDLLPARALAEFEIIVLKEWAPSQGHLQYLTLGTILERDGVTRSWGADSPARFFNLRPKS